MQWSLIENRVMIWGISAAIALPGGVALGFLAERPIMTWRAKALERRRMARLQRAGCGAVRSHFELIRPERALVIQEVMS
jgi:hypothetical protein